MATPNQPLLKMPGGRVSTRPLHFIWIADCSGSMAVNGKIEALNSAIREAIPHMRSIADENPNAELLVRALRFSDGAQWHISQPTPVDQFRWIDLAAEGGTDMGRAFSMLGEQLKMPPMSERALPPVLVLLSDGYPTDETRGPLQALHALPWGKKAVKLSIAIGEDADCEVLQQFIDNPERKPLQANNPEALVKCIKWASTAVLKAVSNPASRALGSGPPGGNLALPSPPNLAQSAAESEPVW
jgi:uncharacterized protein YegL